MPLLRMGKFLGLRFQRYLGQGDPTFPPPRHAVCCGTPPFNSWTKLANLEGRLDRILCSSA
jgi:hypothetical protein